MCSTKSKGGEKQEAQGPKTQGFSIGERRCVRTTAVQQIQRQMNQMGRAMGGLQEILQEKKRADRLPAKSDNMENTILRIFQFCCRDWKEVVTVTTNQTKKARHILNLREIKQLTKKGNAITVY